MNSSTKKTKYPKTRHTPGQNPSMKNNQVLSEKSPAEELHENNQKQLQKIVGKFLYYAGAIDLTILMTLTSLEEVQTKPTIETAKQIIQFSNYSATHPDAVTEYIRSRIIFHIYFDASYISETEARSRAGGYFPLGPKYNTLIQAIPP